MRILSAVLLATLALGSQDIPPISAQAFPEDSGRGQVRIGLGPGWSLLRTPIPEDLGPDAPLKTEEETRLLGIAGFAGFVSGVNDHLSIGVEVSGWIGIMDGPVGKKRRRVQLGAHGVAYVHPFDDGRFFLKGGLGVGVVVIDSLDGRREDREVGLGYLIGSGYDLPAWGKTVITPYLEVPFVRRFREGVPNVIHLGIALGLG